MSGLRLNNKDPRWLAGDARSMGDAEGGMGAGVEHKALSAAHECIDSSRRQYAPTIRQAGVVDLVWAPMRICRDNVTWVCDAALIWGYLG